MVSGVNSRTGAHDDAPLVLIVEDDLSTRVMYRHLLADAGFRTEDAHNGHQALEKARDTRPDAVLTDLAVPGMDGFEFCRALKQLATARDIPILAVTGHSEYLHEPDRFREAGITQVLVKPCPPELIVRELRRLLSSLSQLSIAARSGG
jgi:two-component system, cell cycle response regulator DivK